MSLTCATRWNRFTRHERLCQKFKDRRQTSKQAPNLSLTVLAVLPAP